MNPFDINRDLWNQRTAVHVGSAFYAVEDWLKGQECLTEIELPLLGELEGKEVLHLQCHFGQDTLSLARKGAKVTGIDLSDEAIRQAQLLAERAALQGTFLCHNVYDTPESLNGQFDLVFTSYGTIGWLPDLDKWAAVVARCMKPGGRFLIADFHPTLWMFDDAFTHAKYSYFNREQIEEETSGTYADRYAQISSTGVSWNHAFDEILGSLMRQGLQISHFSEYDFSPYNCFDKTVQVGPRRWMIEGMENKLPLVYAIGATKPL
jgi:2-polyprenyl-3-methyl-5-hydroxy-6-metoxy-1,4-benzoquinol methylase